MSDLWTLHPLQHRTDRSDALSQETSQWTLRGTLDKSSEAIHRVDPELLNAASYVGLATGRDKKTRVPKRFRDTQHITASSKLAEKMHDGE